jgi:hypothetical protein
MNFIRYGHGINDYASIEGEYNALVEEYNALMDERAMWEDDEPIKDDRETQDEFQFRYNTWAANEPEDFYDKDRMEYLEEILNEINSYSNDGKNVNLISEFEFVDFIMDELEELGLINRDACCIVIDKEATANNLKSDYLSIEIDGNTYYYK